MTAKPRTIHTIINEPIFRIVSLKKQAIEVYGIFGVGVLVGLAIGFAIWAHP